MLCHESVTRSCPAELPPGVINRLPITGIVAWGADHVVAGWTGAREHQQGLPSDPSRLAPAGSSSEMPDAIVPLTLKVAAITMEVHPGNAYEMLGSRLRIGVVILSQPSDSAGMGEDAPVAPARAPLERALRTFFQNELVTKPRLVFISACGASDDIVDIIGTVLEEHACVAVRSPLAAGDSETYSQALALVGPHVRLSGSAAETSHDFHDEGSDLAMLPGPCRVSLTDIEMRQVPSLFMGRTARMRKQTRHN